MQAFLAHSFSDRDANTVEKIRKFIVAQDIDCVSGEKALSKSVAVKVKELIRHADLFVGIFTREEIHIRSRWWSRGGTESWTTSNWVIQESGFALGCGKEVLFLVQEQSR